MSTPAALEPLPAMPETLFLGGMPTWSPALKAVQAQLTDQCIPLGIYNQATQSCDPAKYCENQFKLAGVAAAWCKPWAINNKSADVDSWVSTYCQTTKGGADPYCGCYHASAEFTSLQEKLAAQGVGLSLTCNSATCRGGGAYVPSQAADTPCPTLQVCVQDVSVGTSQTTNLSNVNLSCKQESKIKSEVINTSETTNNNTTTPTPTPAGSSLTSGGSPSSSSSKSSKSSSSNVNTQKYVEIGILIFGGLIFLAVLIFGIRSLTKKS